MKRKSCRNCKCHKNKSKIEKYRTCLYFALAGSLAALVFTCYFSLWKKVPSNIKIKAGVDQTLDFHVPASGEIYKEAVEVSGLVKSNIPRDSIHIDLGKPVTIKANAIEKYVLDLKLFGIIPLKTVGVQVIQDKTLTPAGIPIGIYVKTNGVLVVGIGEFEDGDGRKVSPSKYVLQKGDYILRVNGEEMENKKQFIRAVEASEGEDLILTIKRNDEVTEVMVKPECNQSQNWKLGIWIRDNAQGIGTMTYEDTDGSFGALGHGINDVDTSMLMNLDEGTLYKTEIVGITRGTNGAPGELTGYIEYDSENVIGEITENTTAGIFGVCDEEIAEAACYEPIPIALKQEIELGPAQIICSVTGVPEFYDVEIVEVNLERDNVNRGIVIQVADEKLLTLTGGIVQGMSGSPIIQNGKLVGAVTHVLVQDSTRGYGIFIEEMLGH